MGVRLPDHLPRLRSGAAERGVELEVPHPVTGEATGLFVVVRAAEDWSAHYRTGVRSAVRRALDKLQGNGASPGLTEQDLFDDTEFVVDALVGSIRPIYEGEAEVPYSRDAGIAILDDPGNAWLKGWIVRQAQLYQRFYEQEVATDEGNSGSDSSGKPAGVAESSKTSS